MTMETILGIVTVFVTFIMGFISKKCTWFDNRLIPLQNLLIGIIASTIYFFITKDVNYIFTFLGLGTGGTYDIAHNLKDLIKGDK